MLHVMQVSVQHAGGHEIVHLPLGATARDLYVALRPRMSNFVIYYLDKPLPSDPTELHWFLNSDHTFQARDGRRHCTIPGSDGKRAKWWAYAKCV